jgi:cobalt-precorrin 5A hydrolase
MCAYYDDQQKIKKGDYALYNNKAIYIESVKHIKETKMMDIVIRYESDDTKYSLSTPYKTSIENLIKVNMMGSEVVDGYECKPKNFDPNKPIMHYKTIIYLCSDERCKSASKSDDKAKELRDILKEIGLAKGPNRIKISRNSCQGACRYRQVMQINENTRSNGYEPNNGIWLKNTHKYTKEQYIELFEALASNKSLDKFDQISMKVYD